VQSWSPGIKSKTADRKNTRMKKNTMPRKRSDTTPTHQADSGYILRHYMSCRREEAEREEEGEGKVGGAS
jgi:hypothetical protein